MYQTIATLLYPFAEEYVKRDISSKLSLIKKWETKDSIPRKNNVTQSLYRTVKQASIHVPYYRDLFKSINFNPDKLLVDSQYLCDIPVLTKDVLINEGRRLVSEKYSEQFLHERLTGGSTGRSAVIYYSQESLDWTAAVNLYVDRYSGRQHVKREVHLSSEFNCTPSFKEKIYGLVKLLSMNRRNIKTRSLGYDDLRTVLYKIYFYRPYVLQGHPSTLYALALYIRDSRRKVKKLFPYFVSTGETLTREKYEVIKKYIGCEILNRYGNAEFGIIAHSSDDAFQLKVLDFNVKVENEVHHGASELICTGLLNDAMPLIRYSTGDTGVVYEDDNGVYICDIGGRIHDFIDYQGKSIPTHYIQDVLDGLVDEFQIKLLSGQRYRLSVVLPKGQDDLRNIRKVVNEYFPNLFEVAAVSINELERVGRRNKFRYLIE